MLSTARRIAALAVVAALVPAGTAFANDPEPRPQAAPQLVTADGADGARPGKLSTVSMKIKPTGK